MTRLVSSLLLVLCTAARPGALAAEEPLSVGKAAPPFSLRTMNPDVAKQRVVALKNHVGPGAVDPKKAVLLSFAASYCEPCKKELAELSQLEPALRAKGVLTAVIVIDKDEEGIAKMKKLLLEELAVPMPVLSDRFSILARRYGAEKLPYVVLIGGDGAVRWIHAGYDKKALEGALAGL